MLHINYITIINSSIQTVLKILAGKDKKTCKNSGRNETLCSCGKTLQHFRSATGFTDFSTFVYIKTRYTARELTGGRS
jgi:hypothetical protein